MKKITSVANEYIKGLAKLHDKKYRDEKREFLIEGYHLIEEAIGKVLKTVLIVDEKDEVLGVENILVTNDIINKLAFTKTPQNIIGVCNYFDESDIELFSGKKCLLLDNVSDPGNLGTLVRSSLGFNIDTVFLSENSVDIYNDKFIRSTQGAIFKLKLIKKDLKIVINKLKEKGFYIVGTSLKNAEPLESIKTINKYALILGNEANGVSKEILDLTNKNVYIVTNKDLESLNVGVAGGIILYYLDKIYV